MEEEGSPPLFGWGGALETVLLPDTNCIKQITRTMFCLFVALIISVAGARLVSHPALHRRQADAVRRHAHLCRRLRAAERQ